MNLYTFANEYDNLTLERRNEIWRKIFNYLESNIDSGDIEFMLANDFLPALVLEEAEDTFGTEGLDL